jgi:hypothetical protein
LTLDDNPDGVGLLMAGGGGELHEVDPREQVGAPTGERYEFQYHQAAADALQVLDDTRVACIYCEWHDDYVIEAAGVVSYRFHQVKTRSASDGPWTTNAFFGIKRARGPKPKSGTPKTPSATEESIFGRLLDHVSKFGDRCECFVFVTDAGVSPDFESLLAAVRACASPPALSGASANEFAKLLAALRSAFPSLTDGDLFAFLSRFFVQQALGRLGDLKACRTLIGGRIYEASEVDLTMSEAQKIGSDLVAAVREKSQRVLPTRPTTTTELRAAKGLVLDDVLRVLSLSGAGYRELKSGGRDSVRALSRLHRLCKRSAVDDSLVPDLCRLKTSWEAWWISQRHGVNVLDQLALKKECADVLRIHSAGQLDFNGLRAQAHALAAKYGSVLTSTDPITDDLIFGLMLALAVEAEE